MAAAIGAQVEQMILQAKRDSEMRVKHEVETTRAQLKQMEDVITELTHRVLRCRSRGIDPDASSKVDGAFLTTTIATLEAKWSAEVKALKQDLHSTILAHNHNSDLMRHHRDALDEARKKLGSRSQPRAEQVDAQIEKVDRLLRAGQAKDRTLDVLTEKLTQMEHQAGELLPASPAASSGLSPQELGSYGAAAGLGMNPLAGASRLGREAAEDVQPIGKVKQPPTDEEVLQRLAQVAKAAALSKAESSDADTLRAGAPVFVPGVGAGAAATASGDQPTLRADAPAFAPLSPSAPMGLSEKGGAETAKKKGLMHKKDKKSNSAEPNGEAKPREGEDNITKVENAEEPKQTD